MNYLKNLEKKAEKEIREQMRNGEIRFVQHFKRETLSEEKKRNSLEYIYEILDVNIIHSETKERMVLYRSMQDRNKTYVRPYEMFMSEVDHNKYPNIKQKYRFIPYYFGRLI